MVVIGLGPGGEYAANKLAAAGLEVVGVERALVGGECPYAGCTPSKLLVRAAHTLAESRHAQTLGGHGAVHPDWSLPSARIVESTNGWTDDSHVDRLVEAGVEVVRGQGRLDGTGRVLVEQSDGAPLELTARRGVVLGTGTAPAVLPVEGLADTPYWTNREVFHVEDPPASLAVVGGGAIGCELAQVFARFGTRVVLLEAADRLLAPEEPETSAAVRRFFEAEGIDVRTGVTLERVSHDDGFRLEVEGDDRRTAAGRAGAGRRRARHPARRPGARDRRPRPGRRDRRDRRAAARR